MAGIFAGISDSFDGLVRAILIQRARLHEMRTELLEYAAGVSMIAGFAALGVILPHLV